MSEPVGHILIERLRGLRIHRTGEAWELAVITLPYPGQEGSDAPASNPQCAVCTSEKGGMMTTEPAPPAKLRPSCLLEALSAFALDAHVPGAAPLGYLPARVQISTPPPAIREHFEKAMRDLGIVVEVKEHLSQIQTVIESLEEAMEDFEERYVVAPPLIRAKGVTLEQIRSFAQAAAEFWNAEPWRHFEDEVLWEIEPKPKTRGLRCCIVMGGGEMEYGLGFLSSPMDMFGMKMRDALGDEPVRPRGTVWSMTYESLVTMPQTDAFLFLNEQLPMAHPEALPVPMGVTEAGRVMRPNREQLVLMEALLRGFAGINRKAVRGKKPVLTFRVPTFDGEMELTLTGWG